MTSRLAIAAATGSGEAECVEVIDPGGYSSMMSVRPITADKRQRGGDALAAGDQVGL